VRATEAFGGVGVRVFEPSDLARTLQWAREEAVTRRLPLVVDVITERVTNVAMGAEIDAITEFDEFIDLPAREAVPAK
jgi:tartronate-semialdehyde synthase